MASDVRHEALRMQGITKIYANGVVANNDVDFSVYAGEIHAIMGENGAGKTTLMKILFGIEKADSGTILIDGKEVTITSPLSAISQGIGMVHQHFMLVHSLTVAENMVLNMEPRKSGLFIDYASAERITREACEKYNFRLNPFDRVADLSVGSMQKLEILKALVRGARILILDEPTAVLTPQETSELFNQLLLFKDQGYTIIFISHKLPEIKKKCDRITVMRNGRVMGVHRVADVSEQEISRLMVGRDVVLSVEKGPSHPRQVVLDVRHLTHTGTDGKTALADVSFSLRAGEILGVAGVEGNGQRQLVESITGLIHHTGGDIRINGTLANQLSVREIRDLGLSHIPQDRMSLGVAETASISDNLLSDRIHKSEYGGKLFTDVKRISQYVNDAVKNFQIKCATPNQLVQSLSGGNIQKVVVARELSLGSPLIIVDQPTHGVDVGATEFIRHKLVQMRDEGAAILLLSADLNEIIELSDRLIVMYEGMITAYFSSTKEISEELLGNYMLGLKRQTQQEMGAVMA